MKKICKEERRKWGKEKRRGEQKTKGEKKSAFHVLSFQKYFQHFHWAVCLEYFHSLLMAFKKIKMDLMCVFQNPLILNPFSCKSGFLVEKLDIPWLPQSDVKYSILGQGKSQTNQQKSRKIQYRSFPLELFRSKEIKPSIFSPLLTFRTFLILCCKYFKI